METYPPSGTAWLWTRGEEHTEQLGFRCAMGASGLSADDRLDSGPG